MGKLSAVQIQNIILKCDISHDQIDIVLIPLEYIEVEVNMINMYYKMLFSKNNLNVKYLHRMIIILMYTIIQNMICMYKLCTFMIVLYVFCPIVRIITLKLAFWSE